SSTDRSGEATLATCLPAEVRSQSRGFSDQRARFTGAAPTEFGPRPEIRNSSMRRRGVRQGVGRRLLEGTAHVAGIAVREVRTLHHQDEGDALHGVDPGLRAPGAAMPERSWR